MTLFALCVGVVAIVAVSSRALPAEAYAPALVTALLALGGLVALVAWFRRHDAAPSQLTHWDVAGGLIFIGIGLSALIDPDQMVRLLDGTDRRP
jgi:hypothetical protein